MVVAPAVSFFNLTLILLLSAGSVTCVGATERPLKAAAGGVASFLVTTPAENNHVSPTPLLLLLLDSRYRS